MGQVQARVPARWLDPDNTKTLSEEPDPSVRAAEIAGISLARTTISAGLKIAELPLSPWGVVLHGELLTKTITEK